MAAKLKDGYYAFLGMAQPVDRTSGDPDGKKFYFAVTASVRGGDCELGHILGIGQDLSACIGEMVKWRDAGKKRSFVEGHATLTFEVPTDDRFLLSNGARHGVLKALDMLDYDKAHVYLGLI